MSDLLTTMSFTHVVYLYNDVQLSKGHLESRGGGGGEHLKKTERHQVHLFNDKHHNLSIFRTHAQ